MESHFSGPLILKDNFDETFTINESFTYHIGYFNDECQITVPKGFTTDLLSIPGPLLWIFPRYGKYTQAGVLHDYLYQFVRQGLLPRRFADFFFLDSMRILKVPFWKRYIMYFAVRLFGWYAVMKKYEKEN